MTKKEAIYWRNFIEKIIDEKVPYIKRSDVDARRISDFAARFMQTVTGQQYLSQGLFREFLELFAGIPEIQEEIQRAQEEIAAWLENLPEACTKKEVEQMFDGWMYDEENMWLPSMDIDEDGYVALDIEVNEDGFAIFVDE